MRAARRRSVPALLLALASVGAGSPATEPVWRRALDLPGLGRSSAVAFDAAGRRLAVGDEAGVRLVEADGPPQHLLRRGPVRDLLFLDGDLMVATENGLYRVGRSGRFVQLRPGAGAASRDVRRLARAGPRLFVGTAAGVFVADAERRWRRLHPAAGVTALAARETPSGSEAWLVAENALYRATLGPGPVADAGLRTESVAVPDRAARNSLDVALEIPGAEVALLTRERLLVRSAGAWRSLRPPLPAGALPTRLAHAAGRVWIATNRGLIGAPEVGGPWRRAAPPASAAELVALAGAGNRIFAAGPGGVFEGAPPLDVPRSRQPGLAFELPHRDPPIGALQRAALRYLGLEPESMRELRKRVHERGWLPQLQLQGAYGEDRHRGRDRDEVFTSGALRRLHDGARDRDRDWDARVVLEWDLGDTRFNPDAIDVSREAREVIELRDDVLDEITQLYFERQRALDALAGASPAERRSLALRADELAAGLDAWTGGWFGRHVPSVAAQLPPPPAAESAAPAP